MALTGTTTELLAAIRDEARIADDEPAATDTILLRLATRILHKKYVPAVRKCRENYYVTTAHITLETGRAAYPIPRRATTSTIRRVRTLDASGQECAQLGPMSVEDLDQSTATAPRAYAVTDSQLVVWPTPNASSQAYTLEVMFEYRPSSLILPAAALETVFRVDYGSSVWSFSTATEVITDKTTIDIVSINAPFSSPIIDGATTGAGLVLGRYKCTLGAYSGTHPRGVTGTAWVEGSSPIGVSVGDYVCTSGESPIPQIPLELHPCLAMHTAADFLRAIDPQGAADLGAAADADMVSCLEAMTPRKQGTQQRMRPKVRNIRTGGRSGRGGFWDIG